MKHTDVLMGMMPESEQQRLAEEEAAVQRSRDEAKATLTALQELIRCPGWQVFKDYCKSDHLRLMARMELVQDPTSLAKLVGANLAVESFPEWPERHAAELAEFLKD